MSSAIVTAAGSATRFGGGKLLADIGGRPLLDRTIGVLLNAGVDEIIVVIPPGESWTGAIPLLTDERVKTVVNPDPSRGMFSSIQIGVGVVTSAPVAVLPGDMPFVSLETVKELLETAERTGGIVSPRFQGRRGHPVILPVDLRATLESAAPTATLKDVLLAYSDSFVNIDVTDRGVVRDVDVKEDLAR